MKYLIIVCILFFLCGATVTEKDITTGEVLCEYNTESTNGIIQDAIGRDVYVDGVLYKKAWNPDLFISYVMANYLTPETIPHSFAVIRAADRNTKEGWNLLLAYGQLNGVSELASQIVQYAVSIGANYEIPE